MMGCEPPVSGWGHGGERRRDGGGPGADDVPRVVAEHDGMRISGRKIRLRPAEEPQGGGGTGQATPPPACGPQSTRGQLQAPGGRVSPSLDSVSQWTPWKPWACPVVSCGCWCPVTHLWWSPGSIPAPHPHPHPFLKVRAQPVQWSMVCSDTADWQLQWSSGHTREPRNGQPRHWPNLSGRFVGPTHPLPSIPTTGAHKDV